MPRLLAHVHHEFAGQQHGPTCTAVLHAMLCHGRLAMGQLPQAVAGLAGRTGADAAAASPKEVHDAVLALVQRRYLERAPPCTLPPPPIALHPNARKKRAAPKPGSEEEAAQHREADKARRRAEFHAVRFKMGADPLAEMLRAADAAAAAAAAPKPEAGGDAGGASTSAAGGAGAKRQGDAGRGGAAAKKRGRRGDAADTAAEVAAARVKEEDAATAEAPAPAAPPGPRAAAAAAGALQWRVNLEAFNCRFRDAEIVELVRAQHGDELAVAVEALLDAASAAETEGPHAEFSVGTDVELVADAAERLHGEDAPSSAELELLLRCACRRAAPRRLPLRRTPAPASARWRVCLPPPHHHPHPHPHPPCCSTSTGESDLLHRNERGQYFVALEACMERVRLRQVLTAIRHRFGQPAARIWYLLLLEGQLEQKAVSDMAMLSKEASREALYKMLRAGYAPPPPPPRAAADCGRGAGAAGRG
jgi:DNA-directed RNA polymerase III subunit RPC3